MCIYHLKHTRAALESDLLLQAKPTQLLTQGRRRCRH